MGFLYQQRSSMKCSLAPGSICNVVPGATTKLSVMRYGRSSVRWVSVVKVSPLDDNVLSVGNVLRLVDAVGYKDDRIDDENGIVLIGGSIISTNTYRLSFPRISTLLKLSPGHTVHIDMKARMFGISSLMEEMFITISCSGCKCGMNELMYSIVVNTVSKATVSVENASTCDGFVENRHHYSSSGMYLSRYSEIKAKVVAFIVLIKKHIGASFCGRLIFFRESGVLIL